MPGAIHNWDDLVIEPKAQDDNDGNKLIQQEMLKLLAEQSQKVSVWDRWKMPLADLIRNKVSGRTARSNFTLFQLLFPGHQTEALVVAFSKHAPERVENGQGLRPEPSARLRRRPPPSPRLLSCGLAVLQKGGLWQQQYSCSFLLRLCCTCTSAKYKLHFSASYLEFFNCPRCRCYFFWPDTQCLKYPNVGTIPYIECLGCDYSIKSLNFWKFISWFNQSLNFKDVLWFFPPANSLGKWYPKWTASFCSSMGGKPPPTTWFFVTFLGSWRRDPFNGESWPPNRGWKGRGLNHLDSTTVSGSLNRW